MNYEQAYEKLKKYDQLQLLKFYGELEAEQQQILLDEIEKADFEVIGHPGFSDTEGNIEPMGAMRIGEIAAHKQELEAIGIESIRKGELAALLLAGGQGTRLGIDGPKGTLNVGITRELYIFECLIHNLLQVKEQAGVWIPLFIMTSDKNDAVTRSFFAEHDYFGYDSSYIYFFVQEMAVATDYSGKVFLEDKFNIALSPNGNGGWFKSLAAAGLVDKMHELGIKWINLFSVDNVLQRMADPVFLGASIKANCRVGSKVISKACPEEKVGVMCYRNGRPSIVEYYDLTEEMMYMRDSEGILSYNYGVILNYLFRLDALEDIAGQSLPLHIVEKKIPHIDENGCFIKPEQPNGHKYETLVLDMIQMMEGCLAFEVVREKEFAPIKNMHGADSLDTAREMLKNSGVTL